MVYRVLGEFRYADVIGNPVVAFAFTVRNESSRAEVFEPVPGFTAKLQGGATEQLTQYEGPSPADRQCSPPAATEGIGFTPLGYRIGPGHTKGPLEVCMALSPGQRLVEGLFADNNENLHEPAVMGLAHVNDLPAPLTLRWPLPNPCAMPSRAIVNFVGAGTTSADTQLTKSAWDTPQASATCTFYPQLGAPHSTTYVGYVPPPEPSGGSKAVKIAGWPGAELIDSTEPWFNNPSYFWVVTFKRSYHGHAVWGQTWWRGSSCTAGDPADADTGKALYEMFGPGPSISVPAPHHVTNPCTG